MPVRSTNIASTLGFLLAGWLSAAFLPCMLGGPHLASAQEAKRSQEAAKTSNNAKLIAQGDHVGVDFHHRDTRLRQMPVAEFGERAAAQPDHDDVSRIGIEEQKCHHLAGVRRQQRVRCVQLHHALHACEREKQIARQAVFDNERPPGIARA